MITKAAIIPMNYLENPTLHIDSFQYHKIFCFHNNELHIGLNNYKDLYEGNMFRKLDIDKEIELVNEQMKIITNFIDILDLDNDLFRREV